MPNDTNSTKESKEKKSDSNSITANGEEKMLNDRIYEESSSEEVDSTYVAETRTDKEAKAVAKRKSGMPNWLLLDNQKIEEWNLGFEENPKMIKINKLMEEGIQRQSMKFVMKFKDIFAWEHSDLKGVDPEVCQHTLPLKPDTRPILLQRYKMNLNYAKKIKEEIDNLLKARFITKAASSNWLFPIVVVPRNNGKLRVCVDYRKLNAQTIKDSFPLTLTNMMLDEIAGHEMYSFMDGYSGYNQLKIALEDRSKTTFITEWRAFMYLVMPFGLCNALATIFRGV
ncbi:hypothetical protein L7F22_005656 [Adiantum nelumboides]|nr:hypothetical protein [Adiantum nelumboides]